MFQTTNQLCQSLPEASHFESSMATFLVSGSGGFTAGVLMGPRCVTTEHEERSSVVSLGKRSTNSGFSTFMLAKNLWFLKLVMIQYKDDELSSLDIIVNHGAPKARNHQKPQSLATNGSGTQTIRLDHHRSPLKLAKHIYKLGSVVAICVSSPCFCTASLGLISPYLQ